MNDKEAGALVLRDLSIVMSSAGIARRGVSDSGEEPF